MNHHDRPQSDNPATLGRSKGNAQSSPSFPTQNNSAERAGRSGGFDENARVIPSTCPPLAPLTLDEETGSSVSEEERMPEHRENRETLPRVSMPTTTRGLTTVAYERALLNRIPSPKLAPHGVYDMDAYKPTFIHDTLMLPGSLANLIGKGSPEDILNRMTPVLMSGVHAHIDQATLMPRLVHSGRPTDWVQGMLIFGQGRHARAIIHQHYKRMGKARRKTVQVEIEVSVPLARDPRRAPHALSHLERRTVEAHAWLVSRVGECPVSDGTEDASDRCPSWCLEDLLDGRLEPRARLRIADDGKGDEDGADGYIGRDVEEFEIQAEQREVVMAAAGGMLDYERASRFSGW